MKILQLVIDNKNAILEINVVVVCMLRKKLSEPRWNRGWRVFR